jgi:cell division septation protein DedD
MEKKQVLFLLVLVLAVSLLSFTLGVMVGRRGAPPQVVQPAVEAPARIPVAKEEIAAAPAAQPAPGDPAMQARPGENLTFYDALPKGDQAPLGSGINLPPEEKKPAPAAAPAAATAAPTQAKPAPAPAVTAKPAPAAALTAAPTTATAPTAAPTAAASPVAAVKPAASGAYVVQVASFPQQGDAQALKDRLAKKGYAVYTQDADLGAKGIWYRVYIGPFDDSATAGKTVERLVAEERLSALVRKR